MNPNEILIMDTPDKETATKVWRWNSGGFGYSNTGYDGEYGTAMTMDGAIVADFITAGVLRGLEIVNGDGTFHVSPDGNVKASAIDITGGSINISSSAETYDIISLNCREWTHKLSPLEFCLINIAVGYELKAQAGGVWLNHNGETMFWIGAENGDIRTQGDISCNYIRFKSEGSEGYYLLSDWITNLRERIAAFENEDKTVIADDVKFKRGDGYRWSLRDMIDSMQSSIDELFNRTGGSS